MKGRIGHWTVLKGSMLVAILLLGGVGMANATTIDLTTAGASGTLNGAFFVQISPSATGTGLIDSFVQVHAKNTEDAYNTTVNSVLDNKSSNNFNHSITLGDVPIVNPSSLHAGGPDALYRQFMLDINESGGGGHNYISLDEVQIFAGGTANSNVTSFTGGILDHDGTLVYNMDLPGDNWVALDFQLNSGSGSGDMFLYLPVANFGGYLNTDVITLYSEFGLQGNNPGGVPNGKYSTRDGFEEWAVLRAADYPGPCPGCAPNPIPEPTSLLLLGTGLAVAGFAVWRRKKR